MAVLEALERGEGFTDLEQTLARYILDHADEVVELRVGDLARMAYVSNATVIRLCKKVGTDGYRDFRLALAAELERRRREHRSIDANRPFAPGENVKDVIAKVADLTREAVDVCYAALDPNEVDRVARAISSAGHVYFFALGDSRLSADSFGNDLMKLGIRSTDAGSYGELYSVAHSVRRGDVVFVVTYSGAFLQTVERFLPLFKERGARTVLVSTAAKPLGVDYSLRFPAKEERAGKAGTFYSQTCIRLALSCVYAQVYALDYARNENHRDEVEREPLTSRRVAHPPWETVPRT